MGVHKYKNGYHSQGLGGNIACLSIKTQLLELVNGESTTSSSLYTLTRFESCLQKC